MKKCVFLFLAVPSISYGANVTQAQVQQAQKAWTALMQCAAEGLIQANSINALFNVNFEQAVNGSTMTVTIPTSVKNQIIDVNAYLAKKQKCSDIIDVQLP